MITAGAKQKPGQTRLELAEANVALSRAIVPKLLEVAPDAILLLVTNPVDVITYAALKLSGLPPQRVDRLGLELVLPSPLSEEEAEGLRQSADTVKGVIRSLGL